MFLIRYLYRSYQQIKDPTRLIIRSIDCVARHTSRHRPYILACLPVWVWASGSWLEVGVDFQCASFFTWELVQLVSFTKYIYVPRGYLILTSIMCVRLWTQD